MEDLCHKLIIDNALSCLKILPMVNNFCLFALIYLCLASTDYRIVGGYDVSKNKPWIAKLWVVKSQELCGATVINKR